MSSSRRQPATWSAFNGFRLDEACTGRFFEGFNGKAADTGLVNVADRPYKEFLAEVMKTNYTINDVVRGLRPPLAINDPRFAGRRGAAATHVWISRMVNSFHRRLALPMALGPGVRIGADGLVQGSDASDFDATFRLAWDKRTSICSSRSPTRPP